MQKRRWLCILAAFMLLLCGCHQEETVSTQSEETPSQTSSASSEASSAPSSGSEAEESIPQDIEPVSYTHLDVYKRQAFHKHKGDCYGKSRGIKQS